MEILTLTSENFDEEVLNNQGKVLVDFYADWCGPCKMMSPVIDKIAEEMQGTLKVGKVNVDEAQDLAEKYGVMSIPTIIAFENGVAKKTFIGVTSKSEIIEAIK